jgi:Flp pilus assembly protein CpaB
VPVVVARRQLRGGTVLTAGDLHVRPVVAADAPHRALSTVDTLEGRTLAAPVAEGQVLTELALVTARAAAGPGNVVAPLRLGDPGLMALLQAGDIVDVLAADEQGGQARVVARSVRVVTLPVRDEASAETAGALVLVEVSPSAATELAQAAVGGTLTVTWR